MANPEHLAILKRGVEEWNAWRKERPNAWPNLIRANLIRADLRGANLIKAHLREADLRGANLDGTNLNEADLAHANLQGANLIWAHLYYADLHGANLSEADLREANLSEAVNLEQPQLDSAQGDRSTKLPDGLHHPEHWLSEEN